MDQGNQIFSVGGTPSIRLNRRGQTNSNVFPAGCMGNATDDEQIVKPEARESAEEVEATPREEGGCALEMETTGKEGEAKEEGKGDEANDGYVWKRNPLTGEGMEVEKPRSHKKGIKKKLMKWVW